MTRLTAVGRLVAAEDRRLKGWLIPFGVPGHTNLGRVVAGPGTLEVPEDPTRLFAHLDHLDGRDDVATYAVVEERPEGVWAEWDVPQTHGGDLLLAEYRSGKRTGVSVELEPVVIRDGRIVSGTIIGNAFPERPAFDTARLVASLAPDTDDEGAHLAPASCVHADGSEHPAPVDPETGLAGLCDTATAGPAPAPDDEDPLLAAATRSEDDAASVNPHPEGTTMTTPATGALLAAAAAAPAGAGITPAAAPRRERLLAADASPADAFRLLASMNGDRARLMAALADIIPANTLSRDQPQWLGEVWSGNAYQRRIVPLLTSGDLTDLKVKGWRWVDKPAMGRYAGNKTAIPSNAVSTEAYEEEAQRFAGGHDIDIKYRHFGDAAFFAAYFAAMSESYARLTDAYAVEEMKANASASVLGSVPADVPVGWVAIVDAALDIVDVGTPTFALVEKSVYRDMFLTGKDKFLEFLNASIGFESGTLNDNNFRILPVASSAVGDASSAIGLDAGEVLVGASAGVKFRELGGGTPLRVDALNLVNGGVDEAVFGYAHCAVEDARALRIVDTNPDGV